MMGLSSLLSSASRAVLQYMTLTLTTAVLLPGFCHHQLITKLSNKTDTHTHSALGNGGANLQLPLVIMTLNVSWMPGTNFRGI